MNTALLGAIVNTDLAFYFPSLQPFKDSNILTGIHKDFTSDWFSMVGAPIVANCFICQHYTKCGAASSMAYINCHKIFVEKSTKNPASFK